MSWLVSNNIVGQNPSFLDLMDFVWGNMSLGMGALLLSIFVGWVWGSEQAIDELQQGSGDTFRGTLAKSWSVFLKYICPFFILIILANIVGINLIEQVINLFG